MPPLGRIQGQKKPQRPPILTVRTLPFNLQHFLTPIPTPLERELSSSDGKKIIILKASLDYEMSPREPKTTMNGNNPKPKEIHTPASKKTLKLQ